MTSLDQAQIRFVLPLSQRKDAEFEMNLGHSPRSTCLVWRVEGKIALLYDLGGER